jgi:hypothetical protein
MKGGVIGLVLSLQVLSAPSFAQEVFSAEVLLERRTVDASGKTLSAAAPARFRLVESIRNGETVTSLTYLPAPGLPPVGAASDQLAGMRVELDQDSRAVRVFDRSGKPIDVATPGHTADRKGRTKRSTLVGPVARKTQVGERLRELRSDLGQPVGKVRQLERYLRRTGDDTVEVLVLMPHAVPVEVNVLRDGVMESHVTYEYEQLEDGTLFQRVARTETRDPSRPGERSVVALTYSNVKTQKAR